MKETTINIEGMMCEHCLNSVTKAITGIDGVTDVEVSLNPGQAKVNFDSSKIDVEDLEEVITDKGYRV